MDSTLHERMSALARDLQDEGSAELTLQHVVDSARELIDPCHSAGITLAARGGRIETSAATDELPVLSDELQKTYREGPCVDAVWTHRTVLVPDLEREHRWPSWAPQALRQTGMRSMMCLRLFTHKDRVGALNLFARERHAFDEADHEIGTALAAQGAVAVVAAAKIQSLQTGLASRTTIGQAVGLVMGQYDVASDVAFKILVRLSSEQNRKLAVIAGELVEKHDRRPRP